MFFETQCRNADSVSIFLFTIRAIVIALTNDNAQLARVDHQTARQTAESIAGTELGRSVATVSDAYQMLIFALVIPVGDDGVNPKI